MRATIVCMKQVEYALILEKAYKVYIYELYTF